jgi:hypothetical protein
MSNPVTSTSGRPVAIQCATTRPSPPPVRMPTEFRPAALASALGEHHGHADRIGAPVVLDVEPGEQIVDPGERK